MRRVKLFTLLIIITSTSCTDIIFRQNYGGSSGLDFSSGKWLVNEIIIDGGEEPGDKLTGVLLEGLIKMGGKSIIYIESPWKEGLLQDTISFSPGPASLKSIRETAGFDYLITVRASSLQSESGGLAIGEQDLENEAIVQIKVFDLILAKQIYYQEIIGFEEWPLSDEMEETPSKFTFTRSSENIIIKSLKKGLRDMKRKSTTIN